MWGIIPAAGRGSRIQPLAFSKELLPVGSRMDAGVERPCAVSEYLVDRMIAGGATKLCFVISPGKSDILAYYGSGIGAAAAAYVVQPTASGLCDAIFRAAPLVASDEPVMVGPCPTRSGFPKPASRRCRTTAFRSCSSPSRTPPSSMPWSVTIWASFARSRSSGPMRRRTGSGAPSRCLAMCCMTLQALWIARDRQDEFLGTLVNAYLAGGGVARGIKTGEAYVDVGTLNGYRAALSLLGQATPPVRSVPPLNHHVGEDDLHANASRRDP